MDFYRSVHFVGPVQFCSRLAWNRCPFAPSHLQWVSEWFTLHVGTLWVVSCSLLSPRPSDSASPSWTYGSSWRYSFPLMTYVCHNFMHFSSDRWVAPYIREALSNVVNWATFLLSVRVHFWNGGVSGSTVSPVRNGSTFESGRPAFTTSSLQSIQSSP